MFRHKDKTVNKDATAEGSESTQKYSTLGVYGLKKVHDAEDAIADIVFVHGLTGNRESTWTDKASGVFWPAHLLKKDVPKTRIMTFGYDADVAHFWAMASQNRIGNHALNLANALGQMRERSDTDDRPMLFVTHSLGGLVFKIAEPHIQSLFDCTVGVCFLGTPHCGSSAASWASIFGSIANVVKTTNNSLLNVLQPESEVLARIQSAFHTMLRSSLDQGRPALKITCFYEELPVRGVGEIVPKHSAILPAYNSIGIHKNHMDMTKFSSEEDEGYLSVSTEILRWVRAIQKASQQVPEPASIQSAGMLPAPPLNMSYPNQQPRVPSPYHHALPSNMEYLGQQQHPGPPTPYQQSSYLGHQDQQLARAPSPHQSPYQPHYGGYLPPPQQQSNPDIPHYGSQSPPAQEQRSQFEFQSPPPQEQRPQFQPQFQQGGNVISGTVNNYGNGKTIQGNSFQISQGPVNF